jgi:hypothetical protein
MKENKPLIGVHRRLSVLNFVFSVVQPCAHRQEPGKKPPMNTDENR